VLALLKARTPEDVLRDAAEKAAGLKPAEVAVDLRPFIEDQLMLEAFIANLPGVLPAQLAELSKHTA
jgi:hypothetical protein